MQKKISSRGKRAVQIQNAFYIKLGSGGKWEKDSVEHGLMRIGWRGIPLADINAGNWKAIERQIRRDLPHSGAGTKDFNALREIVMSTEEDVWVTFYAGCL